MENRQSKLLQLIDSKIAEAKTAKSVTKPIRKPATSKKTQSNRQNAKRSTGPKSAEGKAKAAANSLKHGFFASVQHLNPHDAPAYQSTLADLRMGLQPDGPVEEQLIRELAMFTTRLQRLEAAEYALLAGNTESDPTDAREIAAAFERAAPAMDQLHKIEIHLRRAYNRTWDRLEKIQKERHKLTLDESLKRSQIWLTYYAEKGNQARPDFNETIKYAKDAPPYGPKDDVEPQVNTRHPAS